MVTFFNRNSINFNTFWLHTHSARASWRTLVVTIFHVRYVLVFWKWIYLQSEPTNHVPILCAHVKQPSFLSISALKKAARTLSNVVTIWWAQWTFSTLSEVKYLSVRGQMIDVQTLISLHYGNVWKNVKVWHVNALWDVWSISKKQLTPKIGVFVYFKTIWQSCLSRISQNTIYF